MKWAKSAGPIENIAFEPEAKMTRAQMGMVLHQYLEYAKADYTVTEEMVKFADEQRIPE